MDATTPSASASAATAASTWRRVAPSERSSANSRVRCATVIEKVLKMMNAPTSSAAPEKASSAGVRKPPMLSLICLASSAAACSPVLISRLRGSAARRRATSSVGVTPGAAEATMRVTLPSRPIPGLHVGHRGDDQRRPADRGHVAVVDDADQPHRLDAGAGGDADALAERSGARRRPACG